MRGLGQMTDPFGQSPEMNAIDDFAAQVENARLIDPTGLETKRDNLEPQVLDADRRIKTCTAIPAALKSEYMSWRSDWEVFYHKELSIFAAGEDGRKFKALEATFHDLVGRLSEYCDMAPAPDSPTSRWPISLQTIAIVCGLVFVGIAAVVASNVYGASKGIGTAVGNAVGGKASRALARRDDD